MKTFTYRPNAWAKAAFNLNATYNGNHLTNLLKNALGENRFSTLIGASDPFHDGATEVDLEISSVIIDDIDSGTTAQKGQKLSEAPLIKIGTLSRK